MTGPPSPPNPDALERFCALVMADEALQMALARAEEPELFVALALQLAGRAGIALTAEDLADALRPDPLGISRLTAIAPNASAWPSRHWLPVRADGPAIDWAHFAGAPLAEPFFAESARRALARPFNRLFRQVTMLGDFVGHAQSADSLAPDGFVFHMSRCGSTLVTQMLAALPGSIVVAEAAPLDAAVQRESPDALKAMVAALGRRRTGDETRYVVKLDFAHALALPLFLEAFPAAPWVFLYRDPVEVLVSQMDVRGFQTMAPSDLPAEQACAQALAAVCEAALVELEKGVGLAVSYADLPDAIAPILSHFGIACGTAERALVDRVSRRNAKYPATAFAGDSEAKRQAATGAVLRAAETHLAAPYRRLEALRRPF